MGRRKRKLQQSLGKGLELDKRPSLGSRDGLEELEHLGVLALCYSPDGQLLATSHADRKISFWLSADGRLLKSIEESSTAAVQLAFTPNGRFLLSATRGRLIRCGKPHLRRRLETIEFSQLGGAL